MLGHLRIITLGVKQRVLLGVFLVSASHADFYMVLHQFGVNVAIVVSVSVVFDVYATVLVGVFFAWHFGGRRNLAWCVSKN